MAFTSHFLGHIGNSMVYNVPIYIGIHSIHKLVLKLSKIHIENTIFSESSIKRIKYSLVQLCSSSELSRQSIDETNKVIIKIKFEKTHTDFLSSYSINTKDSPKFCLCHMLTH